MRNWGYSRFSAGMILYDYVADMESPSDPARTKLIQAAQAITSAIHLLDVNNVDFSVIPVHIAAYWCAAARNFGRVLISAMLLDREDETIEMKNHFEYIWYASFFIARPSVQSLRFIFLY
jgi:hypothetical protein